MSLLYEAAAYARRAGGRAVMQTFTVNDLDPAEMASLDDTGLFGPQSVVWRVNGDSSALIGGFRALLLQALHVRAMTLFNQHTDMYDDALNRLGRTVQFVVGVTFGSTRSAERQLAAIRAVHARIDGLDDTGKPISASDPDLLRWVHITLVDSFLDSYERYGTAKLTDAERDQYVAEMAVIGEGLGATHVPKSKLDLDQCMESYRSDFGSNKAGRRSVRFLITVPGLNPIERAGHLIVMAAAIGSLPAHARRTLRLPMMPGFEPLAVRPAATAMIRTLGWLIEGTQEERNPLLA